MTAEASGGSRSFAFSLLGTGAVHVRYLDDDPDLAGFLPPRRHTPEELLEAAAKGARRVVPRKALAQALCDYGAAHGASPASLEAARSVESEDCLLVVAGQQPGLFGGPLYTLHKVATAVNLCRRLRQVEGAPPVAPLFWNHSEDHDWGEVNHAFLVNPAQELQRIRLDVVHQGQSVRDVPVAHAMEAALAAAAEILPATEFTEEVLDLLRPQDPQETLGSACARLFFRLFAQDGLLVLEPRDMPGEAFELLAKWWPRAPEIRSAVRRTAERSQAVDLDVTVDLEGPLLFARAGGRRVPLPDGETLPRPEALSAGVLLRPLWQDACLPTAAYVCGPGELSYLLLSQPLYRLLHVPQPSLVPRASLTLMEPSLASLLDRFGWSLLDLARGPEALAGAVREGGGALVEDRIEELAQHVDWSLSGLAGDVRATDASLLGPLERSRRKATEEITRLAGKIRNHRRNREGTGLRQIRRLWAHLRPRGMLQERVLPALPFLNLHGLPLVSRVAEAADPFARAHHVLDL